MGISGIDPNLAASLYVNSSKIATGTGGGEEESGTAGAAGGSGGVNFSDFLKDKASESIDTLKASEVLSAKAITGEAELTEVVEAVTAAEVTLQTVVSLRDRMISAYQEIMRMPI